MSSMWGSFCYPQGRGSYLAGHMQHTSAPVFDYSSLEIWLQPWQGSHFYCGSSCFMKALASPPAVASSMPGPTDPSQAETQTQALPQECPAQDTLESTVVDKDFQLLLEEKVDEALAPSGDEGPATPVKQATPAAQKPAAVETVPEKPAAIPEEPASVATVPEKPAAIPEKPAVVATVPEKPAAITEKPAVVATVPAEKPAAIAEKPAVVATVPAPAAIAEMPQATRAPQNANPGAVMQVQVSASSGGSAQASADMQVPNGSLAQCSAIVGQDTAKAAATIDMGRERKHAETTDNNQLQRDMEQMLQEDEIEVMQSRAEAAEARAEELQNLLNAMMAGNETSEEERANRIQAMLRRAATVDIEKATAEQTAALEAAETATTAATTPAATVGQQNCKNEQNMQQLGQGLNVKVELNASPADLPEAKASAPDAAKDAVEPEASQALPPKKLKKDRSEETPEERAIREAHNSYMRYKRSLQNPACPPEVWKRVFDQNGKSRRFLSCCHGSG